MRPGWNVADEVERGGGEGGGEGKVQGNVHVHREGKGRVAKKERISLGVSG